MNEKLLELLVCPISKKPLIKDGDYLVSIDKETRYRYKIEEGIIFLLNDKKEQLSLDEWLLIMQKHNIKVDQ